MENNSDSKFREANLWKPLTEAQKRNQKKLLTKDLTRAERLIIVLYYYEECTLEEIAKTLDLSESRVAQMHSSIVARLKRQLNRRLGELKERNYFGISKDLWIKFKENTHRVLSEANFKALCLDSQTIGTEHILLGLIDNKRNNDISAKVLSSFNVTTETLRTEIKRVEQSSIQEIHEWALQLTPNAKTVIERSHDEAKSLGHRLIDSAHILLALTHIENTTAAKTIKNLGVKLGDIRKETMQRLRGSKEN